MRKSKSPVKPPRLSKRPADEKDVSGSSDAVKKRKKSQNVSGDQKVTNRGIMSFFLKQEDAGNAAPKEEKAVEIGKKDVSKEQLNVTDKNVTQERKGAPVSKGKDGVESQRAGNENEPPETVFNVTGETIDSKLLFSSNLDQSAQSPDLSPAVDANITVEDSDDGLSGISDADPTGKRRGKQRKRPKRLKLTKGRRPPKRDPDRREPIQNRRPKNAQPSFSEVLPPFAVEDLSECNLCGALVDPRLLDEHTNDHRAQASYRCVLCEYKTAQLSRVEEHMIVAHARDLKRQGLSGNVDAQMVMVPVELEGKFEEFFELFGDGNV